MSEVPISDPISGELAKKAHAKMRETAKAKPAPQRHTFGPAPSGVDQPFDTAPLSASESKKLQQKLFDNKLQEDLLRHKLGIPTINKDLIPLDEPQNNGYSNTMSDIPVPTEVVAPQPLNPNLMNMDAYRAAASVGRSETGSNVQSIAASGATESASQSRFREITQRSQERGRQRTEPARNVFRRIGEVSKRVGEKMHNTLTFAVGLDRTDIIDLARESRDAGIKKSKEIGQAALDRGEQAVQATLEGLNSVKRKANETLVQPVVDNARKTKEGLVILAEAGGLYAKTVAAPFVEGAQVVAGAAIATKDRTIEAKNSAIYHAKDSGDAVVWNMKQQTSELLLRLDNRRASLGEAWYKQLRKGPNFKKSLIDWRASVNERKEEKSRNKRLRGEAKSRDLDARIQGRDLTAMDYAIKRAEIKNQTAYIRSQVRTPLPRN